MGPLSAKQHREYLKHEADENRKNSAFVKEQERKEQLHQLKLKEAGAKASQGIAHKEENHAMKLAEGTMKVPRINRQKLGLPSMNPLAGAEVLGQGQKSLPGMVPKGTDTVPAMLTPGEAVIPAPAAQNPKNKKAIKKMVKEGRKANRTGVLGFADGTVEVPQLEVQPLTIQDPRMGYTAPMYNGKYIENIPTRSNNPGNLMYAGQPNAIPGVPRANGGNFALFANPQAGVEALERQVAKNTQERGQSIKQMMAKYAPKSENNTAKYVKNLSKDLGISPTAKVPMSKVPALSRAISKHEGYKGEYYSDGTTNVKYYEGGVLGVPLDVSTEEDKLREVQVTTVPEQPNNSVITVPKMDSQPEPVVVATPTMQAPAVVAAPLSTPAVQAESPAVVATPAVTPVKVQSPVDTISSSTNVEVPAVESFGIPLESAEQNAVYDPLTATRKVDYETRAQAASAKVRSVAEIVEELGGKAQSEKSLIDSFKNLFTAQGFKEELGFSNQDIVRMAISTAVGARRYGFQRALAYAGREAFQAADKRKAQEIADQRAIRSAAVQIHGQEVSNARSIEAENKRNERALENNYRIERLKLMDQRWKETQGDLRAQRSAVTTAQKEFGDLVAYVPPEYSKAKAQIMTATTQAVNQARKENNLEAEHNAWSNGFLAIASIADKRAKGSVVNTGDKEPKVHTLVINASNTPIQATRVNTKGGGFAYQDSTGKLWNATEVTPIEGANYINRTVNQAVNAVIPELLPDGKKNPTYTTTTAAINTAFETMDSFGMPVGPNMKAQIAAQAVTKLTQANMPITPDNITRAIYAESVKLDTQSPLLKMPSTTTFGGRNLVDSTTPVMNQTVQQIIDISRRENVSKDVAARRVEQTWQDLTAKEARKIYEKAPLNVNTATWWYSLPQTQKDEILKGK